MRDRRTRDQNLKQFSISRLAGVFKAAEPPSGMTSRLFAIDGPGGAGKSQFARALGAELGWRVVDLDDFGEGATILDRRHRVMNQLVRPLSQNGLARYQRYDWERQSLAEWHDVAPGGSIIVEGVTAACELLREFMTLSVWIEAPSEIRLERGLARDGPDSRTQWDQWMAIEDDYIVAENPREHVDLVLSGVSVESGLYDVLALSELIESLVMPSSEESGDAK